MPFFRIELGELVENGFDLGLDQYPIFDEGYRQKLNDAIIDHYYTREIGMNAANFKAKLNIRMNEIMPVYNEMYIQQFKNLEPYVTQDIWTVYNSNTKSDGTSDTDSKSKSDSSGTSEDNNISDTDSNAVASAKASNRDVFSDTPSVQLSNHKDYATNLTDGITSSTSNQDTTQHVENIGNNTFNQNSNNDISTLVKTIQSILEHSTNHISGYSGTSLPELRKQYNASLYNTDLLVINDLKDLFYLLYTYDLGYL